MGRRRKWWNQDDTARSLVDMALAAEDRLGAAYKAARARVRNGPAERAERRRVAVSEAWRRRRREEGRERQWTRRRLHVCGWRVLLERMEPGAWYGRPDLVALMPEFAENSVRAWLHQKLLARGLVERTLNPAHDDGRPDRRQLEPRYLYRRRESGD